MELTEIERRVGLMREAISGEGQALQLYAVVMLIARIIILFISGIG
jgi:hypothetical protein